MSTPPSPQSPAGHHHRLSETYLLALARNGNQDGFTQLARRYETFIRHKAKSFFLVGADSDDLIQSGVIGLHQAVHSYRPDRHGPFHSYAQLQIMRTIIGDVKHTEFPAHKMLNDALRTTATTPAGPSRRLAP